MNFIVQLQAKQQHSVYWYQFHFSLYISDVHAIGANFGW